MIWPFSLFRRKRDDEDEAEGVTNYRPVSMFSGEVALDTPDNVREALDERLQHVIDMLPKTTPGDGTTDSCEEGEILDAELLSQNVQGVSEALFLWFATQGFIGHQMCALLSQNWLINKACTMPGRDAVRQGYEIKTESGDAMPDIASRLFKKYDKKYRVNANMVQFVRLGRTFGIRIAFCRIKSDDPEFYEKPFNPDGIRPGSYRGIVQVDPYWTSPLLDAASAADPSSIHFYEPTYWLINGQKFHRSHLIIFKTCEMPDILKPSYYYGGVPVPQAIMERVYASERTANEGPNVALSKRTTVLKTDVAKAFANEGKFITKMRQWMAMWSNFGVKVIDKEDDEVEQFDTSLADFDALIMTQFQLVCAAAEVPATKMLGTTPKGMNATGEYDESSYHESLESIQTHDLTPLLERHHLCVMHSFIKPRIAGQVIETYVDWAPLDSPTMKEYAEIEEIESRTAANYATTGAVDQYDIRESVINNKHSMFNGLAPAEPPAGYQEEESDDEETTNSDVQRDQQSADRPDALDS